MKKIILALVVYTSVANYALSSELVYTPINPSFGGKYKDTVLGENNNLDIGEDTSFISGDYQIDIVAANSDTITIQITDLLSNKITIIEIPKFG